MTRHFIRTVEALRTAADTFLASAATSAASKAAPSSSARRLKRQREDGVILSQPKQSLPPRQQHEKIQPTAPATVIAKDSGLPKPTIAEDASPVASTSKLEPSRPSANHFSPASSIPSLEEDRSRSLDSVPALEEKTLDDDRNASDQNVQALPADEPPNLPLPEELVASLPAAMSSSSVPSSRLGRLFQYGGMS